MARSWSLVLLAPALSACYSVVTVQSAVPDGKEVFEPRLVGSWELRSDTSLSSRLVITREGAAEYLVRDLSLQGPSAAFKGRLGPLGPGRWLFELSPVGDTSSYVHPLSGRDSTRLLAPELPLLIPVRMPLVLERPDSGLVMWALNGDSLNAALKAGRLQTPFTLVSTGDISATILLTEQDPQRLNAALQAFVTRQGALIPLSRVGWRVALPSMR